jgi:hypothetical protein
MQQPMGALMPFAHRIRQQPPPNVTRRAAMGVSSAKIIRPASTESTLAGACEAFDAAWGRCTQEGTHVVDSS